jgi:hypothetical protein
MYVSMSVPEQGKPFGFGIMNVISFLRNLICRDRIGLQWMDRTACTHLPSFCWIRIQVSATNSAPGREKEQV